MTKEEKLEILCTTAVTPDMHPDDFGKWDEAFRSAIESLSAEPCEDAISRAWLKEAIHNFYYGLKHTPTEKDIQAYIDVAPSVTLKPKMGRWIPVSERLPEESLNSVIGWDAYRERCVFVQYIDGHFQITGKPDSFDIIAWMPLPAPYRAESEDKE